MTAPVAAHPTSHGHGHGHGAVVAPPVPSGERARAIVFARAGRLEARDVSLRVAAENEVVVDTAYSSISTGTERLLFSGKLPGFPMLRYPLVPGYEAVGSVVRIGSAVTNVAVGDAVFVGGSMCYTDVAGAFGGQSSRLIKDASLVVPLHGIALERAPLLALAATSLHGIARLGDVRGKRVCVLGMGAIGQFAARFLHAAGATVIAADTSAARLNVDVPLEAALHLSASSDRPASTLDEHVHDLDAVVEATGRSQTIADCARALRPGGTIALLSYYDTLDVPYVDLFVKEVTLVVAREWARDDLLAARDALASGTVGVGDLADCIIPASEYERAYDIAFNDLSVSKVILKWA